MICPKTQGSSAYGRTRKIPCNIYSAAELLGLLKVSLGCLRNFFDHLFHGPVDIRPGKQKFASIRLSDECSPISALSRAMEGIRLNKIQLSNSIFEGTGFSSNTGAYRIVGSRPNPIHTR